MSERVVLDASAALPLVLGQRGATRISRELLQASLIMVPTLYGVEVASGLWKYVQAGALEVEKAQRLLAEAQQLPSLVAVDGELLAEALDEGARRGHPVYDMLYAVLARRQAATLISFDERLRKVAKRMGVRVLAKR